jgi:predicted phosphoribosyltransferase
MAAFEVENIIQAPSLREKTGVFSDRAEAGRSLARLMAGLELDRPLVLAVPAGGVPVGRALADATKWELDVAVVSKISLPWNTEVGFGAVAFDGTALLNEPLMRSAGLSDTQVDEGLASGFTMRRGVGDRHGGRGGRKAPARRWGRAGRLRGAVR